MWVFWQPGDKKQVSFLICTTVEHLCLFEIHQSFLTSSPVPFTFVKACQGLSTPAKVCYDLLRLARTEVSIVAVGRGGGGCKQNLHQETVRMYCVLKDNLFVDFWWTWVYREKTITTHIISLLLSDSHIFGFSETNICEYVSLSQVVFYTQFEIENFGKII